MIGYLLLFSAAMAVLAVSTAAAEPPPLHGAAGGKAEPGAHVVTMQSLLEEMIDRDAVARKPSPSYVCKQASSWDRTQVLGTPSWWNNHDYNHFLREEQVGGRTEYVIMEDAGPGCITRIWKPLDFGNETPKMTIRFYLDGNDTPALQGDFSKMASARGIFEEPFSFIASDEKDTVDKDGLPQGHQIGLAEGYRQMAGDLYFPIPYAKGCKVTIETHTTATTPPGYNVFYYHVNYRSYEPGTLVESFTQSGYDRLKDNRTMAAASLSKPGTDIRKGDETRQAGIIKPGQSLSVGLPQGPGAVREFVVALNPTVAPAVLRSLFVAMTFDGEETVWCPVSEFFGGGFFDKDAHPAKPTPNGVFVRPHWNRNRQVEAGGRFSCYFVMPYQSQASVQLRNTGNTEVQATMTVRTGSWTWDDRSMLFHANWRLGNPTRPSDWNYIEIKGDGVYVADTLSVFNSGACWYGEGDERIYIDGETFPSYLGTGTEDYYGYAWGMANFWNSPFMSAPDRDARGKANWSGNHTVSRERLLDAIPFRTSLKVDMEAAENGNVPTTYAAGTFWYARPGAGHNREMPPREAAGPVRENAGDPKMAAFPVAVRSDTAGMHIDNGIVAVDLSLAQDLVAASFKARTSAGGWREVCESFRPDFKANPAGNKLFDTTVTGRRYQASEIVGHPAILKNSPDEVVVRLTGARDGVDLEQTLSLRKGDSYFHVEVTANLKEPLLDYLMSSFTFRCEKRPEFIHSPTVKMDDTRAGPGRDQVIGDHAFHAPAVILQEGGLFAALVPDLQMINQYRVVSPDARRNQKVARNQFSSPIEDDKYTMPTALDLNVVSGLTPKPVLSYGMMDFIVCHHVRYQRVNDESMVRKLNAKRVRYGFDLFLGAEEPANRGYQKVVRHQWRKYGHEVLRQRGHLAMPFDEYVKTVYGVVSKPMDPAVQAPVPGFKDHGVFLDFELGGQPVGGMVAPLGGLGFGDALWNFEFWNNVRDAGGMYHWGKKLNMPELAGRAQRIVNLALQAPQNADGFFCLTYKAQTKQWLLSTLGPSPNPTSIFDRTNPVYDVPAMSKTAAHLLEYYQRCKQDERIITFLRKYADGLIARIDGRGAIPSYYTPDMKPLEALHFSAQPAASMWFLAEIYSLTKEQKYLDGARRIAAYLQKEILPAQKWIDLEAYYSCGRNPLDFLVDTEQGLPVRGNLSAFWAAKGFAALYRATGEKQYLDAGEQVVDYACFSQACWAPHYVYAALPFGGFTVDNIDTATWLDARQCEMVEPFIWYGQTLGRQDLIERGVATARSSVVLINLPQHKENDIYRHPNLYGFGLGPENINHEGHNQSAGRSHPGWGECSGIFTGLADADRMLGGCYVNVEKNYAVGVNGVYMRSYRLDGKTVRLDLDNQLAALSHPYDKPYEIELRIMGLPAGEYSLVINDQAPQQADASRLAHYTITIRRLTTQKEGGAEEIRR